MKYFIFDSSNDGVIWTSTSIVVANKLKEGLIDCDMGSMGIHNPIYTQLTMDYIKVNNCYWDGKNSRIKQLPEAGSNSVYLEKKRLAKLRSASMHTLHGYATWSYRKTQSFPHQGMDSELDSILLECNPEQNIFSFGIREYALTFGMPNVEAYKQLRLRVDNYKSQRMRVYSYFDYFSSQINGAMAKEDIDAIDADMHKKFIKDSFI
jgi:hypothetical protein